MSARRRSRLRLFAAAALVLLAGLALLVSQLGADGDSGYPEIGRDLEPLRAAFNAAPGHVRAVLLASPT